MQLVELVEQVKQLALHVLHILSAGSPYSLELAQAELQVFVPLFLQLGDGQLV